MIVLGSAMVLTGIGVGFTSIALLLRAYRGQRIPYALSNEPLPAKFNVMQAIGSLLIVATGFFVAPELAPWNLLVLLLAGLTQIIMVAAHNRRVEAEQQVSNR